MGTNVQQAAAGREVASVHKDQASNRIVLHVSIHDEDQTWTVDADECFDFSHSGWDPSTITFCNVFALVEDRGPTKGQCIWPVKELQRQLRRAGLNDGSTPDKRICIHGVPPWTATNHLVATGDVGHAAKAVSMETVQEVQSEDLKETVQEVQSEGYAGTSRPSHTMAGSLRRRKPQLVHVIKDFINVNRYTKIENDKWP